MDHQIDYARAAVEEAWDWAGMVTWRGWELAFEHIRTLGTWKLLNQPPRVAGRGLVLLGAGASIYGALAEARRSLNMNPLD